MYLLHDSEKKLKKMTNIDSLLWSAILGALINSLNGMFHFQMEGIPTHTFDSWHGPSEASSQLLMKFTPLATSTEIWNWITSWSIAHVLFFPFSQYLPQWFRVHHKRKQNRWLHIRNPRLHGAWETLKHEKISPNKEVSWHLVIGNNSIRVVDRIDPIFRFKHIGIIGRYLLQKRRNQKHKCWPDETDRKDASDKRIR